MDYAGRSPRWGINWAEAEGSAAPGRGINWATAVRAPRQGINWASSLRARLAVGAMAGLAALPLLAGLSAATGHRAGGTESVIVESVDGAVGSVTHAIAAVGGTVDRHLGLIGAVSARVPAGSVATLAHARGVKAVVPDARVHLESLPADYSAAGDGYSLYSITAGTGAQAMWQAGYTGAGVGVALIDSGVAPVEGLDRNVVYGPDLSFDSQSRDLAYYDSFGHGTHMAGIIAGRDASATSGGYAGDTGDFLGMAPDAHIVSVKVADSYGDVDVSQLIAGIDWVVAHRDDPGL
ncbi:MAG TPA: S8 family serine peptidase, partial [Acidimicrobiales bacterium]|nr:S8 family serine peptidase [Acidimicrobiales bacterium]